MKSTLRFQASLLLVVVGSVAWLTNVAMSPPAALPADAPADQFSGQRAFAHVRAIAQKPRPSGSPENQRAREYIIEQRTGGGLHPEIQQTTKQFKGRPVTLVNVMARIPGFGGPKAVALVGHHDSLPETPGASDDASAVATLLESGRALRSGPALQHDVILLFTDGEEEDDLNGAECFVESHPWMKDIGLVLNFEARGVTGPVVMFETSLGNGRLISEFARAVARPVANSIMHETYRHLPNNTDFTPFKRAGLPGYNFAFLGEPRHIHTSTDDLDHLDIRCLQHNGDYALGLTRHFGNLEVSDLRGSDAIYFDLFGRMLVRYPTSWAIPLGIVAALLFLGVLLIGRKRGRVSLGGLALGAVAMGISVLGVVVVFTIIFPHLKRFLDFAPNWVRSFRDGPAPGLAAVGLTVALSTAPHALLRRWISPENLGLGALLWWVVLGIHGDLKTPTTSYVTFWPLLFSLIGVGVPLAVPALSGASWWRFALICVTALAAVVVVTPLIWLSSAVLGSSFIALPMVVLTFLLGVLTQPVEACCRAWPWSLPLLGITTAVASVLSPLLGVQ